MEMQTNYELVRDRAARPSSLMPVDSLSQIATEVEAFLAQWMSRLEELLDHYGDPSKDDVLHQRRVAEFEREQRRWHEHRQQEMQQIQATMEQLTAAWERLEDEQRRVLQAQETLQQRARERGPAVIAKADAAEMPVSSSAAPDADISGNVRSGNAATMSRDLAVRQFQQLRRQMGIHTPESGGETP